MGKTSLRALLYFWKMSFYNKKISAKNYSKMIFFQQANLSVFSPTDHLETCLSTVLILLKSCLVCVPNCCLFLLLVQKSPLLSCSHSPNLLMKEMIFSSFSSFNITPSDFWVIQSDFWVISKSNGWNRFRSMAEIKCTFKSHFLFFNSPTLIKTHLVIYFQSHFFLSNFSLTL